MIKPLLKTLLLGLAVLGIMFIVMTQVTVDMRVVLLLGSFLFLATGYISGKETKNSLLHALLLILPFSITLVAVTYTQLLKVNWFIIFYYFSAWSGICIRQKINFRNLGIASLMLISLLYMAFAIMPGMLDAQLSEMKNEDIGTFSIFDMEGKEIESTDLLGKVVVLDFFGTWCKPCLMEIQELTKVHKRFETDQDVVFFVINTAEGGDTIEKMNAFIDAHDYPFQFGFDVNKALVDKFQLRGVPYLFIFDKDGRLRYEHVGYNKGETHFSTNVIEVIESLQ